MARLGKWSLAALREINGQPTHFRKGYFAARKLVDAGFAAWTPHLVADRLTITEAGRRALAEEKGR